MENQVLILENIQDKVYADSGVTYRPTGIKYIEMVLRMSSELIKAVDIDSITPEVKAKLTDDNYHMIVHAIDCVMQIDKYSYR